MKSFITWGGGGGMAGGGGGGAAGAGHSEVRISWSVI